LQILEVLVLCQPEDINLIKTTTGAKTADLQVLQAGDWDKVAMPLVLTQKLCNVIEVQSWIFIFTTLIHVIYLTLPSTNIGQGGLGTWLVILFLRR